MSRSGRRSDARRRARKAAVRATRRRRPWVFPLILAAIVVGGGALIYTTRQQTTAPAEPPEGVKTYEVTERSHVEGVVQYEQIPPVGGNHSPAWQNCGAYSAPIANENAVHSLEHGAVWIAYRPGLDASQVGTVRAFARKGHVLVSPFPELKTAVVASAWGVQLELDSARDPRLDQFVKAYRLGPQTPEPGAACSGGVGTPSA